MFVIIFLRLKARKPKKGERRMSTIIIWEAPAMGACYIERYTIYS